MQVRAVESRLDQAGTPRRASRRLYLPTLVLAAWLSWQGWQGWHTLAQYGVARSVDAGRFGLAGPAVLGFVLAVCLIEQIRPAQRRPLLARGHLLDFATCCSTPCSSSR